MNPATVVMLAGERYAHGHSGRRRSEQAERSVVVVEVGDRMPVHVQAIQLDAVLEDDVAAAARLLRGNPGRERLGPSGDRSEIALDRAHGLVEVDLADQRQAGVGGHIEAVEERRDIIQRGRLEVLHHADRQPVVRMLGRIHRLGNQRPDHAVGAIGVVLAVLVLDHLLLDPQLATRRWRAGGWPSDPTPSPGRSRRCAVGMSTK